MLENPQSEPQTDYNFSLQFNHPAAVGHIRPSKMIWCGSAKQKKKETNLKKFVLVIHTKVKSNKLENSVTTGKLGRKRQGNDKDINTCMT